MKFSFAKKIFFVLLLLLVNKESFSQVSVQDSIFMKGIFNEGMYINKSVYPGNWYVYDSVNSINNFYTQIDSIFKFSNQDFTNAYQNISIDSNFYFDTILNPTFNNYYLATNGAYKQLNPLIKSNFSLNGKKSISYSTFSPCINSNPKKVAYFIIPGSNNAQTSEIIRGSGYHNLNCYVKNSLIQSGDVFIHCKPLEDYRALYWNNKKLNSGDYFTPGNPSYIYNYLNSLNKPYGINYLIECYALIKLLNKKYDKVIVLGCSQGGYATMITTIDVELDGSLIASGYSKFFDTSPTDLYALQQNFGGLPYLLTDSTIKSNYSKKKSEILFSWANPDLTVYQMENVVKATKQYFQDLPNVNYFFNYAQHSFPPCYNMDTFFQRVINKPKVKIDIDSTLCTTDSIIFNLKCIGKKPMKMLVFKDSILTDSITTSNYLTNYIAKVEGNYQFRNIYDSATIKGFDSKEIAYIKEPILQPIISKNYNCNTNKNEITISAQTIKPYLLNYTLNNSLFIDSFNINKSFLIDTGRLNLISLKDANGCNSIIGDTLILVNEPINIAITDTFFNCDSNVYQFKASLNGKSPYKIYYYNNFILDSNLSYSNSFSKNLNNGLFQFFTIKDDHQCSQAFNYSAIINYNTIDATVANNYYSCDSNKAAIAFALQGNAPYTLAYTKDAVPQSFTTTANNGNIWLSNGNYEFTTVTDATGCVKNIDSNYLQNIVYAPITINISTPVYSCDSLKTKLHADFAGNPPYQISYTFNGNADTLHTNTNALDVYLPNGVYQLISAQDITGCSTAINQVYTFNYNTIDATVANNYYSCDSNKAAIAFALQGNAPYTLAYTKDAVPQSFTTTANNGNIWLSNGNYEFTTVTDATGCVKNIDSNYLQNIVYAPITINISTPVYSCDSLKTKLHADFAGNPPYQISYTFNGNADTLHTNTNALDVYLPNGVYQLISAQDITGCSAAINQVYTFNYNTIDATVANNYYSCDSNKAAIAFALQGNAPYTLAYTKDAVPQSFTTTANNGNIWLSNGNYEFTTVTDATGCVKNIDSNYLQNIVYAPITINISTPVYSCDSLKTKLHADFAGNPPYQISYTFNGNADTLHTNTNALDVYLPNGVYQLISAQDITGCSAAINQVYTFNYNTIDATVANNYYSCDSNKAAIAFALQGNAPWAISYVSNGNNFNYTTNTASGIIMVPNGTYTFVSVSDGTGCSNDITTNNIQITDFDTISVQLSNITYLCDSLKTKIHFDIEGNPPFTIYYTKNNNLDSIVTAFKSIDEFYANGTYQFINIKDVTACSFAINQTFQFNNTFFQSNILSEKYDCDSNKYKMVIQTSGNSPFTILYTKNGILNSYVFNDTILNWYVSNGNYFISKITDNNGCEKLFNKTIDVNFQPISYSLLNEYYDCNTLEIKANYLANGNAPFQIVFNAINNNILATVNSFNSFINLQFTSGLYNVLYLKDSTNCIAPIIHFVNHNIDSLGISKNSQIFNCDSNKVAIHYSISGTYPIQLFYRELNTNTNFTVTKQSGLQQVLLPTGNYILDSIKDFYCLKIINDTTIISFPKLSSTISPLKIECDSNRNYIEVNITNGLPPFTFNYILNSINQSNVFNSNYLKIPISNSTLIANSIQDSIGCVNYIFTQFNANYKSPKIDRISKKYICSTDSTEIFVELLQPLKTSLAYTFNSIPSSIELNPNQKFNLPNGNYIFNTIKDTANCIIVLDSIVNIDFEKLKIDTFYSQPNCSNKLHDFNISIAGQSPFTINIISNNLLDSMKINSKQDIFNLSSGDYYFNTISDATNCTEKINISKHLQPFFLLTPTITSNLISLNASQTPSKFAWRKDNYVIDSNSTNTITSMGSGNYQVIGIDSNNCQISSDMYLLKYPNVINIFPNPTSSFINVIVDNYIGKNWKYSIRDMQGNELKNGNGYGRLESINVSYLAKGIYTITIEDDENLKQILKFRKDN